jgi:hypothetical protein
MTAPPEYLAHRPATPADLPRPTDEFAGPGALHIIEAGDPQASHLLASLPAVIILRGARGPAREGLEVARRMALSAIHRDPGHDWAVEELARTCSLSRSAFAARFVALVGKPPARWRKDTRAKHP